MGEKESERKRRKRIGEKGKRGLARGGAVWLGEAWPAATWPCRGVKERERKEGKREMKRE